MTTLLDIENQLVKHGFVNTKGDGIRSGKVYQHKHYGTVVLNPHLKFPNIILDLSYYDGGKLWFTTVVDSFSRLRDTFAEVGRMHKGISAYPSIQL